MLTLEYWHVGVLLVVFIVAMFHMYWSGFRNGVVKTAETLGEDGFNRALKFLESQDIIRFEEENGETMIYPGKMLEPEEDEQ